MEYIEKINKDTPKLNYTAGQGPLTVFTEHSTQQLQDEKSSDQCVKFPVSFEAKTNSQKLKKKQLEILSHKISGHSEMKLKVNTMETLKSYTHTTRLNSTVEWAVSVWEIGKNI